VVRKTECAGRSSRLRLQNWILNTECITVVYVHILGFINTIFFGYRNESTFFQYIPTLVHALSFGSVRNRVVI
jgi:hypothetical protein